MIEAVLVDAYFTIFTLQREQSRYDIIGAVIRRRTGIFVPTKKIAEQNRIQRATWEDTVFKDNASKWLQIDKAMLANLGVLDPEDRIALAIHEKIMRDSTIYEVKEDIRAFFQEANRRGVKVIIASNSDRQPLHDMISTFELEPLLHRTYSFQEVGHEKPNPEFFRTILEKEGLRPGNCIMVGNNPRKDLEGCRAAGLVGVLYDPREEYHHFEGYRITSFQGIWVLDLWSGASCKPDKHSL